MADGDYRLTLEGPDGETVWSRDIRPEHVESVAQLIKDNIELITAAQGAYQATEGITRVLNALRGGKTPARRSGRR